MLAPDEIIVDSFAGGGGASTGIEMALGRSPDIAINHDAEAVALHAANHPATRHLCNSVWRVRPEEAVDGRPVGLLWASPDCKHFSKAKGAKPVEKNIRDLAWVVVLWARTVRPRVIMLENVEEFRDWGPLITAEDGKVIPCPLRKGHTFRRFVGELRRLGYRVEHRELRACDYGAPTIRKRLFLIARCDGAPIVWPAPTHFDPKGKDAEAARARGMQPWRTAAECIDWSIPCPSIFGRKRPLVENTMARIARGLKRYVIDAARPFIVPVTHAGDQRAHAIDEPLRTITTAQRGEQALVTPFVTKFRGGATGHPIDDPLHTVTANSFVTRPGGATPLGLVAPVIVSTAHSKSTGRGPGAWTTEEPLRTVAGSPDHALVAPFITGVGGRMGQSPPRPVDVPAQTLTAKADSVIVAPFLAAYYGTGEGNTHHRVADLDEPLRTATVENRHALVAAFMAQHNGGLTGHAMEEPVSTLTQGCAQQQPVMAWMKRDFGTSTGAAVDGPLPTVTTDGGGHASLMAAFLQKYYGTGGQDQDIADPMHTLTAKARMGLVTVAGVLHRIVDIGMRMLDPRELYRAQGFPESYVIDRGPPTPEHPDGRPLTKTAQIRMCGNSVCPPVAAALVAANLGAAVAAPEEAVA